MENTVFMKEDSFSHKILTKEEEFALATEYKTSYSKFLEKLYSLRWTAEQVIQEKNKTIEQETTITRISEDFSEHSESLEKKLSRNINKIENIIDYSSPYSSETISKLLFDCNLSKKFTANLYNRLAHVNSSKTKTIDVFGLSKKDFRKFFEELDSYFTSSRNAKDKFIEHNLRLVLAVAKAPAHKINDFADSIQEGNIGLMRAVEKFDPSKGYKFSTYAVWWIRQAINRHKINQLNLIRIPFHVAEARNRYLKVHEFLSNELDREPTDEELMNELKITEEMLRGIQYSFYKEVPFNAPNPKSHALSSKGLKGNYSLEEILPDTNIDPNLAEDNLHNEKVSNKIFDCLHVLSERDQYIIIRRFGLDNEESETLQNIADRLGLSRERVRQIEAIALNKIREIHFDSLKELL